MLSVGWTQVVEAYRLDRYDNSYLDTYVLEQVVVEAYRLDRYDNISFVATDLILKVVEVYRLDRYDNLVFLFSMNATAGCRSLSFG